MSPEFIGIMGLVLVFGLIFLGMPIAICLMLVGFVGLVLLSDFQAASTVLANKAFIIAASFNFACLPLFLLMGEFALHGGIGEQAYRVANAWVGRLPAGLAMGTVLGCATFGAVSGSSLATTAIFSELALPEMSKRGYDIKLSVGSVAASGTLACLIPPSGVLVVYGILTETSIGPVLMAGYIPGVVSALIYMAMIFIRVKLHPELAPLPSGGISWRQRLKSLGGLWAVAIILLLMVGGIYTGMFTPTEGAAIGALGVLIIAVSRKRLTVQKLMSVLWGTARISATIFLILTGALVFSIFMAMSQITTAIAAFMSGGSPQFVIICFLLVFMIMGMFLPATGMMCLGLPVFFPIVRALGISPIWFGILLVKTLELGGITPPLGINCFVVKATVGEAISLSDIFRGIIPFAMMDLLTIAILFVFPSIVTWLPSQMGRW